MDFVGISRHVVNSIPELMVNSNSRIDYLKKMELELIKFELELKFPTKQIYPQINLPLFYFIQKFSSMTILHGKKLLRVGIPSRYLEYLGIDTFEIEINQFDMELSGI